MTKPQIVMHSYGEITVDRVKVGYVQQASSCCGISELSDYHDRVQGKGGLERFGWLVSAGVNELLKNPDNPYDDDEDYNAVVLYLVENWQSFWPMADALLMNGWTCFIDGAKNPNTPNTISGFVYQR